MKTISEKIEEYESKKEEVFSLGELIATEINQSFIDNRNPPSLKFMSFIASRAKKYQKRNNLGNNDMAKLLEINAPEYYRLRYSSLSGPITKKRVAVLMASLEIAEGINWCEWPIPFNWNSSVNSMS